MFHTSQLVIKIMDKKANMVEIKMETSKKKQCPVSLMLKEI